ncbi:bifunctional Gfo/Idh/MocA family oxidoreductase/class I SAM-dependent methyltransferase [Pelosinus fermentans]|uniref:Thiazolinyl imide reductase n=1 Tax=Pelosinus fermentans JBW45 TaxID=1192197 RepID=I9NL73_9FIRM|nr:bifunctional Gfo/Idh/MocA family oxidoreductase/class I SAM-dependent methyltransferase [Pelosinus fermentans]AJQ28949.1 thiazolinyl imide reductase [Pelosinus fermentans JBW45]
MKRKKIRTVVCGSTFGQFYLEALKTLPEEFELAGLLARGSERSAKCAAYYGINLYTEADQLPDDIDLACVVLRSGVMGGKGTDMSLRLLERGIHVIQEQPVHHKDVAACLRAARQQDVFFQTGDLYVHLPAVRRFIACAQALLERQNALYIDAAFASQVSYPMMHIFSEALPSIRPWKTGTVSRDGGPFHVMTGTLGKIPAILRVHNEVDPDDPDNYLHLLHRITIGSEGGSLSLTDTHGPVVWQPRLHIPENLNTFGDFADADPEHLLENSIETLGPSAPVNYKDILTKQWPHAIARDLSTMRERILGGPGAAMRAQQELLCSSQWQEMTATLGYPVLRPGCSHQPLSVNILREAAAEMPDDNVKHHVFEFCFNRETNISSCTEYADSELCGIDSDCVNLFVGKLDKAVFSSMLYSLQTQGVLTNREREYSIKEILSVSNTALQHQYLIMRWLELLSERGYLKRRGDYFYDAGVVTKEMLQDHWNAVRKIWDGRLGSPLTMDYLISNAEQLPQLMSGKQQAALLLFPEGRMDYANALYRETITARYLNKAVSEAVIRIGAAKKVAPDVESEEPLRVLEIGAGTGATTDVVVPRLKVSAGVLKTDYLFTDVSNFFLSAARERFKDCPWMRFRIANIDKDFIQQGLQTESADIIIAAGVMNNAFNINETVDRLMQILVPGGWILITEPTREFPEMLISQAFMMTRPEDDRKNTNTTFMSVKQWQDVFQKTGAVEVLTLPNEDHPLAPLGQKIFAVRK